MLLGLACRATPAAPPAGSAVSGASPAPSASSEPAVSQAPQNAAPPASEAPPEAALPPVPGLVPGQSPPAARTALGKLLFFDPALSGDQKLSCATCHQPDKAWTDGLPLSLGYPETLYFRNTPSLLNVGYQTQLFWDGRLGGDLETTVRDHIAEAHFMNADGLLVVERLLQKPAYGPLFQEAFGGEVSYGRVLSAVAAYVGALNSSSSPYDRFLAGEAEALSPQAQTGLQLFEGKAGCSACHSGPLLSDGGFHNLGVPTHPEIFQEPLRHIVFRRFFRTLGVAEYRQLSEDPGLYALTQWPEDWGRFRTPSLRDVARTAPYMHNGVFETLEEVIRFYDRGGGEDPRKDARLRPLGLTDEEVSALVAFLESLSGDAVDVQAPELPGYERTGPGGDR